MRFCLAFTAAALTVCSGSAWAQRGLAMSRAEARQLYAAGGFPISADGRNPLNKCGKSANPKISFVDVNADGRKDALFIDAGACYGPDGRWFSIAVKEAKGSWRGVAGGAGTVRTTGAATRGWFDLEWTSASKTVPLRYDGSLYSPLRAAPSPISAAKKASDGEDAIFLAAGFKRKGKSWHSDCDDPGTPSYSPGAVEMVGDLNKDGLPEAIVTEGGTYCFGMTGTGFWLLSQQRTGGWKLITRRQGIPEMLKTRGVGGWPDISVGGPGFCFPVLRWNGKDYVLHRREYEGKPCRG